jgi:hypothetical protein
MPRSCSICAHPQTADVAKAIAAGGSNRSVADRFAVTPSAVQRHRTGCLRSPRRAKTSGSIEAQGAPVGPVRFESARCHTCGTLLEDSDPQALVKRAERLLWVAETIASKAQKDDDARLALQAVDRARASLEQLLRVHGLLQPDGAVTVTVDARRQVVELFSGFHEATIRAFERGDCPHCQKSLLVDAAPALGEPKMNGASRNDVPE